MSSNPVVLPPEPWYRSEVQVRAVIALAAQAISILFRIIARYTGFEIADDAVDLVVADITQLVAIVFAVLAVIKRQHSSIQPLTLTAGGAAAKAAQVTTVLPADPTKQKGVMRVGVMVLLLFVAACPPLFLLHGCSSLGLQQPKSFDERWSYAQGQTTGLRDVCTKALDAHLIASPDMEYCIKTADSSSNMLVVARAAHGEGDVSTAEGRLALVSNILTELEQYLQQRGAK